MPSSHPPRGRRGHRARPPGRRLLGRRRAGERRRNPTRYVHGNPDTGSVVRVDPVANKVVATIKVSAAPIGGGDIAVGGGSVWARATAPLAARIDPDTNKVTAHYGPLVGSGGVADDDSAVWAAAHDVHTVWRLPLS